ncbi:hypothetical protein T552_03259 [Pneumocystis carinii B80]|uniref:AAA+ ATPase domain-containing protein n=1 Tax=Pneumocystis carinii (strain B80) TaxID=1408658 RepID=A0A0W4ZCH5_PNEC8|nr:hypothetical protein T552_03259 [Pneumocystis carinii B80]KTW25985.1 hypothetical protein T552_03259 [Pneumocystis carinii B80]
MSEIMDLDDKGLDKENITYRNNEKLYDNIYNSQRDILDKNNQEPPMKMKRNELDRLKMANPLLLDGFELEFMIKNTSKKETTYKLDEISNKIENKDISFNKMILEEEDEGLNEDTVFQKDIFSSEQDDECNSSFKYERSVSNKCIMACTSYGKIISFKKKYKKLKKPNFINENNYYGIPIHKLANFSNNLEETFDYNDYNLTSPIESQLWVKKYAPKKFMDLIGDDRIHREVLRWIKHWDFCVFGKYLPQSKIYEKENELNYDFLKRPKQKILMLTGTPGLGKTTLAHIAARQAGYNVIEINASDDRTGAVVKNQISNVLDIQSIHSNSPTLIIIDEIDGVSNSAGEQGFIKSLVDILIEDDHATKELVYKKSETYSKKGKTKSKKRILLRPIICICNDLYTAALRPIRQYSKIIYFKQIPTSSLVSRMHTICKMEGLSTDIQALTTLCEIFENDFRSCINSLQFYKTHGIDLTSSSLDKFKDKLKKDSSKNLNLVLDKIFFSNNKSYKNKYISDNHAMFMDVYETIQNYGDYEKLINNCFMHYLSQDYKDDQLSKPVLAGDWLFFFDTLNRSIYEKQNMELLSYLVFPLLIFHILFISVKKDYYQNYQQNTKQISNWELYESEKINREICASLYYGSVPYLQQILCIDILLIDVVPYLIYILLPTLNSVNLRSVKNTEKHILNRVVNSMIHFNINYVEMKANDGTLFYKFEPSIETLVTFNFLKRHEPILLKYSVCHIINLELENEKRRIQKERYNKNLNEISNIPLVNKRKSDEPLDAESVVIKDFFGRVISKDINNEDLKSFNHRNKILLKPKAKVWIKFHEGYSNAVKKSIPIEDILK